MQSVLFSSVKSTYFLTGPNLFDALRDLIKFLQIKKRENTHALVLLLVKLQAELY